MEKGGFRGQGSRSREEPPAAGGMSAGRDSLRVPPPRARADPTKVTSLAEVGSLTLVPERSTAGGGAGGQDVSFQAGVVRCHSTGRALVAARGVLLDREDAARNNIVLCVYVCIYIYIYTYVYVYVEREREIHLTILYHNIL